MGHKVLLADDSITVQKIVKLSLTEEGIEVIALGNGEQAVQQLATLQPDLVMADVFMPGKDGYEVCEFVKSHPQFKHTPVILLVHAFEPFDPERAKKVGADQQLTKPFQSIRTLVTTVRDLLATPVTAPSAPPADVISPTPAPEAVASVPVPPPVINLPEEEFAVVSSLASTPHAALEPTAAWSGAAGAELVALPAFGVLESSLSEPSSTAPLAASSAMSAADFLPPVELSVLSQSEWQTTSVAPAMATPEANPLSSFSLAPSAALSTMSDSTDDVLDLSGVLSAPQATANLNSGLTSPASLKSDVPLLAVLPSSPAELELPEGMQEQLAPLEGSSFAPSIDMGVGQLSPLSAPPVAASSPEIPADRTATASFAQANTELPISEALIDEIVNRVVQRLSTQAIQEIAWEVVPEMAELLLRKQLSQQQQAH